jgi:hypothetical protein
LQKGTDHNAWWVYRNVKQAQWFYMQLQCTLVNEKYAVQWIVQANEKIQVKAKKIVCCRGA